MKLKYAFISSLVLVSSGLGCTQKVQPTSPIQNDRPIIIYVNTDDQSVRPSALRRVPLYAEDSLYRHNSKPKLLRPYMPELETEYYNIDENHIENFSVQDPSVKEIVKLDDKSIYFKCLNNYLENPQELRIIKKGFRKCPIEIVEKIKCKNINSPTANFGCVYGG
jgi:hypothetical protein